jgi:hypothetical protein
MINPAAAASSNVVSLPIDLQSEGALLWPSALPKFLLGSFLAIAGLPFRLNLYSSHLMSGTIYIEEHSLADWPPPARFFMGCLSPLMLIVGFVLSHYSASEDVWLGKIRVRRRIKAICGPAKPISTSHVD